MTIITTEASSFLSKMTTYGIATVFYFLVMNSQKKTIAAIRAKSLFSTVRRWLGIEPNTSAQVSNKQFGLIGLAQLKA